jgi:hypothetical protein
MSRRRSLIVAIAMTAGCWITLLAIVRSEFKLGPPMAEYRAYFIRHDGQYRWPDAAGVL